MHCDTKHTVSGIIGTCNLLHTQSTSTLFWQSEEYIHVFLENLKKFGRGNVNTPRSCCIFGRNTIWYKCIWHFKHWQCGETGGDSPNDYTFSGSIDFWWSQIKIYFFDKENCWTYTQKNCRLCLTNFAGWENWYPAGKLINTRYVTKCFGGGNWTLILILFFLGILGQVMDKEIAH